MLSEVARKYETYKKNNYKQIESLKQAIDEEAEAKTIRALKVQNHVLPSLRRKWPKSILTNRRSKPDSSATPSSKTNWLAIFKNGSRCMRQCTRSSKKQEIWSTMPSTSKNKSNKFPGSSSPKSQTWSPNLLRRSLDKNKWAKSWRRSRVTDKGLMVHAY